MERDELVQVATRWMADDPDASTRAATLAMLERGDVGELAKWFDGRLEFGTAGMRGPIGPGPLGMNRALVRRVTAGLGHYLLEQVPDARARGVAIGFDGRHGSADFAEDAARVLGGLGVRVYLYDAVTPTPQLANAVVALGAAAGIMVTASHNPPADNGYKVYWGNGAQILPPHDGNISRAIDAIDGLGSLAVPPMESLRAAGLVSEVPMEVLAAYLDGVHALRVHDGGPLRVVYTAMHGVGAQLVEAVLTRAGYTELHMVPEQRDPDPDFSTVAFPNPEEPGALDLAIALAKEVAADILIANDPDADRLAVAVPDGRGGYRQLTGNQVGCLLAEDLLTHGARDGGRMVATTIVSSTLLAAIAREHGADYAECLTGFKWIANRGITYDEGPGRFVMGYEEALGYSVGAVARDKDGVSAALLLCDLAAFERARGRTLVDALESLGERYGVYGSSQKALVMPGAEGAARIRAILAALRADPPTSFGGVPVVRVQDVWTGREVDLRTGEESAVDLPQSNVLAWHLEDGSRVLARPSGTEPKVKFYFEVRCPLQGSLAATEAEVAERMAALADDVMARLETL